MLSILDKCKIDVFGETTKYKIEIASIDYRDKIRDTLICHVHVLRL